MKRDHVFVILLCAILATGGAAGPGAEEPLPQGPAPDLALVYTSQVKGWIEPCG